MALVHASKSVALAALGVGALGLFEGGRRLQEEKWETWHIQRAPKVLFAELAYRQGQQDALLPIPGVFLEITYETPIQLAKANDQGTEKAQFRLTRDFLHGFPFSKLPECVYDAHSSNPLADASKVVADAVGKALRGDVLVAQTQSSQKVFLSSQLPPYARRHPDMRHYIDSQGSVSLKERFPLARDSPYRMMATGGALTILGLVHLKITKHIARRSIKL